MKKNPKIKRFKKKNYFLRSRRILLQPDIFKKVNMLFLLHMRTDVWGKTISPTMFAFKLTRTTKENIPLLGKHLPFIKASWLVIVNAILWYFIILCACVILNQCIRI